MTTRRRREDDTEWDKILDGGKHDDPLKWDERDSETSAMIGGMVFFGLTLVLLLVLSCWPEFP